MSLFFNSALAYAIRRVQVNQNGLELNGTHQLLFNEDDVNVLGRSIHTVKGNTEALLVASKKVQLEVNGDKTKYMVMSGDKNAGQSHNRKIDNSSFERFEEFRYLGTTLRSQISIQVEMKRCLQSGNACCHLVQNVLSSSLLS